MKKEEKAPEVQALRGPMPTAKWINLIEGFPPFPWPTLIKADLHSRRYPAQSQYVCRGCSPQVIAARLKQFIMIDI
jgi:hypothetical protein